MTTYSEDFIELLKSKGLKIENDKIIFESGDHFVEIDLLDKKTRLFPCEIYSTIDEYCKKCIHFNSMERCEHPDTETIRGLATVCVVQKNTGWTTENLDLDDKELFIFSQILTYLERGVPEEITEQLFYEDDLCFYFKTYLQFYRVILKRINEKIEMIAGWGLYPVSSPSHRLMVIEKVRIISEELEHCIKGLKSKSMKKLNGKIFNIKNKIKELLLNCGIKPRDLKLQNLI